MTRSEAIRTIRDMAARGSLSHSQAAGFVADLERGANPDATVKLARAYA